MAVQRPRDIHQLQLVHFLLSYVSVEFGRCPVVAVLAPGDEDRLASSVVRGVEGVSAVDGSWLV